MFRSFVLIAAPSAAGLLCAGHGPRRPTARDVLPCASRRYAAEEKDLSCRKRHDFPLLGPCITKDGRSKTCLPGGYGPVG